MFHRHEESPQARHASEQPGIEAEKHQSPALNYLDVASNVHQSPREIVRTEGCTAMSEAHMRQLIKNMQPNAMLLQVPMSDIDTIIEALR